VLSWGEGRVCGRVWGRVGGVRGSGGTSGGLRSFFDLCFRAERALVDGHGRVAGHEPAQPCSGPDAPAPTLCDGPGDSGGCGRAEGDLLHLTGGKLPSSIWNVRRGGGRRRGFGRGGVWGVGVGYTALSDVRFSR